MSVTSGCRLKWSTSVGDIVKRTSALINYARSVYDKVGSSKPTFESVVLPISLFEAEYQTERNAIDFPQHTFPCKAIRDASCDATRKLSDVEVELEMRKDVFEKFVSVQKNIDSSFSGEYRRYVDRKVQLGRRNGLHLDDDKRKLIEALNKEENQLCIDFQRALNEENTLLEFTDEELTGCPADFIDGLKKLPSGKREVSLKYPHYFPIMQKASNPETRRTLETAFNSRCIKENTPILKRLMELRRERATILGFPTHADFMLDLRMAKTAANVDKFLNNVGTKLKEAEVKETARLLELKKEECDRLGYTFNNCLNPWDTRYYMNMVKERDYSVDEVALKKYFPLATVKSGILRLYQQLLGLKFERVPNAEVWHEEVEMYSVSDSESNSLLGYFYLDLHPREGKYGHAAVFGLQPGCRRSMDSNNTTVNERGHSPSSLASERQLTIAAMVANFTAPDKETGQGFLLHSEVETFFHEFGHLMHQICSQTETAFFSGTAVETDFVECPSQMLENWVWNVDGLKALLDTNDDPIPKDLLANLINSRIANAGLFYSRQILLASFDQAIHTTNWEDDPLVTFTNLSKKWIGIEPTPGTFMPASFGHLAGGYDARYYSYLWSEVFSADMFESRFQCAMDGGCLSKSVGRDYREKILRPGGSKDATDMLKDFLGREPNDHAFFKLLKVNSS
ncbi:unnamed protein product [Schistosoma rodhaini]|uniref:Peptidase M3A/M3B catalytic domain-containing protein n=1 Tax=Schistosoma rodhaini TaxID=6188 RepID=A0AA85FW55_9TREM|nr:unnamed protein product [Schistosoma rodhaini]CAH8574875.1 unnamed protein product [Schistosoma rodhaini]